MGKFFKGVVKFSVAAAAVGGLCYAFKDKIRESKVYQDNNVDEKINKVKTTIKDKMPKIFDNEDDIEEDDLFADDLDLEMEDCASLRSAGGAARASRGAFHRRCGVRRWRRTHRGACQSHRGGVPVSQ